MLVSLPLEGLRGYGDFHHFFNLASMGWPYLDYWVEFPPVFPILSRMIYIISNGQEHIYDYLIAILLSLVQTVSIYIFIKIALRLYGESRGGQRGWVYFAILVGLAYGWWYFDPLAVLAMMAGLWLLIEGKDIKAGIAFGFGALVKLFPLLGIPVAWRFRRVKQALYTTLLSLTITIVGYGLFFIASPEFTISSIRSQASKGSWETVWALLDTNYNTGNFGPEIEHLDPKAAMISRGNPARISPWITFPFFLGIGVWIFTRPMIVEPKSLVAFLGITWCIFVLWMPGWSPQWVLYLLPLILLALPDREAILMAVCLVLINLLEWPILLSRGYNWGLWITIPVRTLLLILCAWLFWTVVRVPKAGGIQRR